LAAPPRRLYMAEFKPLDNARLKIERAKKHIDELDAALKEFLQTDCYRLEVKVEGDPPLSRLEFETKPVPKALGAVVGDAIHNCRASLDVAIEQMIFEKTGAYSDYAKFPFRETRDELIAACKGGDIRKAGEHVVEIVVDKIRAYKGGNDLLYALHDLDIQDKHVLVLPHITVTRVTGVDFEDERKNVFRGVTLRTDSPGHIRTPLLSASPVRVTNKGQPSLAVVFGVGLPLEGKPLVPSLVEFTKAVVQALDLFEAL
jgi:hypothetical protein